MIDRYNKNPARRQSIMRCVPEIFDANHIKSVLYIGANKIRQCHLPDFINAGIVVTILEPFCDNVVALQEKGLDVILGDARACSVMFDEDQFDAAFWWHGPEHIPVKQIKKTLLGVELITKHLVVLAVPWGESLQGPAYGNIYETHIDNMEPEIFTQLGYNTETIGNRIAGAMQNNVLAWKWVGEKAK